MEKEHLKKALSMSYEGAKMYVKANPDIVYKGVPLAVLLYFASPLVMTAWCWLPWMYISYNVYNKIPTGTIPTTISSIKKYINSPPHNFILKIE